MKSHSKLSHCDLKYKTLFWACNNRLLSFHVELFLFFFVFISVSVFFSLFSAHTVCLLTVLHMFYSLFVLKILWVSEIGFVHNKPQLFEGFAFLKHL